MTGFSVVFATGNKKCFPSNFMFGAGSSAYQVEGGWNTGGKTPSMWDNFVHEDPSRIVDNSTGDVACDSYHQWKTDIQLIKSLRLTHYRFSISWPRILPTGFNDTVNPAGIGYYKSLIRALKKNNIIPMVTMFHWDVPENLEKLNGVLNDSFPNWFEDYARVLLDNFGKDVNFWLTVNEPKIFCTQGYGFGTFPPGIHSQGIDENICNHNILRAHARVYHLYQKQYNYLKKGKMSIVFDSHWFGPNNNNSKADKDAAETAYQFELGWQANPVFFGDYPEIMKVRIGERSKEEGRNKSRLPEFTKEEKAQLKGSVDFFALNTYTGALCTHFLTDGIRDPPNRLADMGVNNTIQPPSWESTSIDWLKVVPYGVKNLLKWIKNTYKNPDIFIIENGYPNAGGVRDTRRLEYHRDYLKYIRESMDEGIKVVGYTIWSLMDNYEWALGYTEKFGIIEVDFHSSVRKRTKKLSATWYSKVCETKCIPEGDE